MASGGGLVPMNKEENDKKEDQEMMDAETLGMLVNPGYFKFKEALEKLHNNPSTENLFEVHLALLMDGAQDDPKIHRRLPELYNFLPNKGLYKDLCVILSDISHHNTAIVDSLLEHNIFERIDFSEDTSFSLLFSICDDNKKAWKVFTEKYLSEEHKKDSRVQKLLNNPVIN